MAALSGNKVRRTLKTIEEVFLEVSVQMPHLADRLRVDRNWVWLAGTEKPEKEDRKKLWQIGFRFKKGDPHALADGEESVWGHACTKPTWKGTRVKANDLLNNDNTTDPLAAMEAMGL